MAQSSTKQLRTEHDEVLKSLDEQIQALNAFKAGLKSDEEMAATLSEMVASTLFFKIDLVQKNLNARLSKLNDMDNFDKI